MQKQILRSVRNRVESSELRKCTAVRKALIDRAGGCPVSVDPEDHWLAAHEWLVEQALASITHFNYAMEKFVVKGVKVAGS